MWTEILEQHDQKREYSHVESVIGLAGHRGDIIERQLKVIDRKLRVANFLLRMRQQREAEGRSRKPTTPMGSGLTQEKPEFGLSQAEIRAALASAASELAAKQEAKQPSATPVEPQLSPAPEPKPNPVPERQQAGKTEKRCPSMAQPDKRPAGGTTLPPARLTEAKNTPHNGGNPPVRTAQNFNSATQSTQSTHTSGEKGGDAKRENREV